MHDRILRAGEQQLTAVPATYTAHYNELRPHRWPAQRPPAPCSDVIDPTATMVKRRSILGGLINEYSRAA